jgi:small subunit ribosomal protein S1
VLVKDMGDCGMVYPCSLELDAVRMKAWDDLEKAYRENSNVKGRVIDRIKGGLRVDIDGIAAFLPGVTG